MKKYMDKLSKKISASKKTFFFFATLFVIAIIISAIFFTILNSNDKMLVNEYLNEFITSIKNKQLNYIDIFKNSFFNNFCVIVGIWLLGISVIGLPLIIFIFFVKSFILGFATASLIFTFKMKGSLLAFIYIFPHQLINILILYIISMYATFFSIKIIKAIVKKKNIEFKTITNHYLKILLMCLVGSICTSLIETFLTTNLLNIVASTLTILI